MRCRRKPRATGATTKFRLLMWKNFLQQWRHPVQTVVEVLLPVAAMALVLVLRWQIIPVVENAGGYPSLAASDLHLTRTVLGAMNLTALSIAYSPRSPAVETALTKAMARLVNENKNILLGLILERYQKMPSLSAGSSIKVNVLAYDNAEGLRKLYSSEKVTRQVIAGVEFDDVLYGATELPVNLQYSLRFPEMPRQYSFFSIGSMWWRTDLTFPSFQMPGPRFPHSWEGGNDPGYVDEMFIALQQVISMELVSAVTGQSLDSFVVAIRRYPHASFVQDAVMDILEFLLPMFLMISFSYTAVSTVRAITIEKELQLKETMKIMGLPTWLHWTAWFCKQFIFLLIIAFLILIIVKVHWFKTVDGFSNYAILTNTPWSVFLFFLLMYLACTIFFCFMLSEFFTKASTAALFTGVIWFLSYMPAFMLMVNIQLPPIVQALLCLSVNTAMAFGFHYMLSVENSGGLQWSQFWQSDDLDSTRCVFGTIVIMLIVDCVLYMLIALYLEQVFAGPYSASKPWYFLFKKRFWFPKKKVMTVSRSIEVGDTEVVAETVPDDLIIGVKMTKLTKVYGTYTAVNDLTLEIFDGQITVLLGHNGAGKSTTISMLTGNIEITSGWVWLAGYDVSLQSAAARANLGFCPQHNVLFNELTVREHLEFFSRLKGFTGQELREDIDALITKLELDEKRNYKSAGLSGGQKRRLSVGIALSGAPRVVLLDEPTSGMDPSSRRALWDLLQKEKAGRSMILTTHFMDEADILGDRVAIMSSGRLQCVGSPYFLKQHYGVGYTLVVVKSDGFKPELCTEIIRRHIPRITIKEDRGTEVTYALKNNQSHLFEPMLKELEANIANIKFQNYGLTATTLEEVFMRVGSDLTPVPSVSVDIGTSTSASVFSDENQIVPVHGSRRRSLDQYPLWVKHVLAVWLKLFLVWSRSWLLLLLQVLVPLLTMTLSLGVLKWAMSIQSSSGKRELTLARGFSDTVTLLSFNGTSSNSRGALAKTAYENMFKKIDKMKITAVKDGSVGDYYLNRTSDPSEVWVLRKQMLIGATFDDNSATAWFSNFGYHDVAISLSAVHEALLEAWNPKASLRVFNYPLEVNYANEVDSQTYVERVSTQLASGIGSSLAIASAVFIMFYIKERTLRAKLLQQSAGIQPLVLWASSAVFDWAWFIIICLTIVIICVAFQVAGLCTAAEVGRMYLILMIYGAAMLPLVYLVSFIFTGPVMGFVVMFFINVILGQMAAQIVETLRSLEVDTEKVVNCIDYTLQFFPLYSLVRCVMFLNQVGVSEWSCMTKCSHLSAVLDIGECNLHTMCKYNYTMCCVRERPYFEWEEPGMLRYITCSLISCVVLWGILMFIEYKVYRRIYNWKKTPPPLDTSSMDSDVVAEMRHVEAIRKTDFSQHSLVAKELSKYYGKHLAVNQISFTMAEAEVFGLLGVNGAGKTTTFKMLMGDETVSSGDAFICGHSVKTDITNVHKYIGYCPQFDAVFGELTGRETLRLFSMLRGLPSQHSAARAELLADALGFAKHLDKRIDMYSGGNQRKLSTAIALMGSPRLVFVDEPTTGVDPAAKRRVWKAFRDARRAGRGVVLTSHSMEECEALCTRLTIMVNGGFQCLGTPQHLKNKFSEGFTLRIKMKMDEENTDSIAGTRGIPAVKRYIESNFNNPKLMEEYQGLLTYYLPDQSVPWSKMFGIMERCRQQHDVEDYTISQTTLEQIFLQFTKYQKERPL